MRKLFVLLGAPAVGKSTWIKENNLEKYTVEPDMIRDLISAGTPVIHENSGYLDRKITHGNESKTWDITFNLIRNRMKNGETVFVDATNLFKGAMDKYRNLLSEYPYEIFIVDFMEQYVDNADFENMLITRDAQRGHKINSENVFGEYIKRYKNNIDHINGVFNGRVISPEQAVQELLKGNEILDFNKFDKINIIGDIHGDYDNLMKVFANHKRGTAYIFVGDLFDRGPKNTEVFKFIKELHGDNIFILEGNHDTHLMEYVYRSKLNTSSKDTIKGLLDNGYTHKQIREFTKRYQQFLYFNFRGNDYFVSHAGLDSEYIDIRGGLPTLNLENTGVFIHGVESNYHNPYERDIDSSLVNFDNKNTYNIHGHRNSFNSPVINEDTKSANLTRDGEFRWLELTSDGQRIAHVEKSNIKENSASTVYAMTHDDNVNSVDLDNGLTAHNFSREVFRKGLWTPTTMQARGMFTEGDNIIGRGFNKFFNVGENKDARLDTLEYPVKGYLKENGYLGLAFMYDGQLTVETKSGQGYMDDDHQLDTLAIIKKLVLDNKDIVDKYTQVLTMFPGHTITFEAIAPSYGDFHLTLEKEDRVVSLAVINNITGEFNVEAENILGIKPLFVAADKSELAKYIKEFNDNDRNREGLVLRGTNKLLKIKTSYYLKAKELRAAMKRSKANPKTKWFHGGKEWYERACKQGYTKFTPELALKLYDEDKEGK